MHASIFRALPFLNHVKNEFLERFVASSLSNGDGEEDLSLKELYPYDHFSPMFLVGCEIIDLSSVTELIAIYYAGEKDD